MVRVVDSGDRAMATGAISKFDINLDNYCTWHMTPCFLLEKPVPCIVDIVVENKERLQSMHKGNMRLGNLVFTDVLFVPGLLQTLISEPQLELKGCKIVSEKGVRTISRNGKYLFHATLERNSYVFRPNAEHDNSRQLQLGTQEVALLSKEKFDNSAELWHLRLGHLDFADMCKLRTRATGVTFKGEACFCQPCTMAKMKCTPFQNKGHIDVLPKQNVCYDVSGPYPPTVEGFFFSFNAICKSTGMRWRDSGRQKSGSANFLTCF